MRRPGYLGGAEEDLLSYMTAKYPGWQSQGLDLEKWYGEPRGGYYSSPYFPFGPTSPQLLHPHHGFIPESDVISSRMQISTPSYKQAY
jgi:hypothetical protein